MLEILFLIWFWKKLAGIAADKGRTRAWGALGLVAWVGGEVGGAVIGANSGADGGGLYGYALLGAIGCAIVAFAIVKLLPVVPPPDFPTARVV